MNNKKPAIQKEPLYMKIYQDICDEIMSGSLCKGDRLSSEKEIAARYEVSRITSKKAMDMLADRGFIKRTPGRGSFVSVDAQEMTTQMQKGRQETELAVERGAKDAGRLIGVVMEGMAPSYGTELLHGIEERCAQEGYSVVIKFSYGSKERETACIEELLALEVSGILLMCAYDETYSMTILQLSLKDYPLVFVDRKLNGLPIPFVGTDNSKAAEELTGFLFSEGHRVLSLVMGEKTLPTSSVEERVQGYLNGCMRHGASCGNNRINFACDSLMHASLEDMRVNVDRMRACLQESPEITGFVALSFGLAAILQDVLAKLRPNWQQAYEIACFDFPDSVFSVHKKPVYICQGERPMGRLAVERLLQRLKGEEVPRISYVPYTLVRAEDW